MTSNGSWIKMRGALINHPKVVAVARCLNANTGFREWITPGYSKSNQIVTNEGLRCVTVALLLRLWSVAREHGRFVGDDLFLPFNTIDDLDEMAGAPGVGAALRFVGWAIEHDGGTGVTLPNFSENNVPKTNAEKQADYRARQRDGNAPVTKALPKCSNGNGENVTTRVEESREEKKELLSDHSSSDPLHHSSSDGLSLPDSSLTPLSSLSEQEGITTGVVPNSVNAPPAPATNVAATPSDTHEVPATNVPASNPPPDEPPDVPPAGKKRVRRKLDDPALLVGFDKFWALYPRLIGKPAAIRAWKQQRATNSIDAVLDGVARWWDTLWSDRPREYIPHPSTWLNQRRWEDDLDSTPADSPVTTSNGTELAIPFPRAIAPQPQPVRFAAEQSFANLRKVIAEG